MACLKKTKTRVDADALVSIHWARLGVPEAGLARTSEHMKTKNCPDCNGDGVIDKDTDKERQCPTCGGLGFVRDDDDAHEEVIKTLRL
jgi:hypothetical protein